MMKKYLVIIILLLPTPVMAVYDPPIGIPQVFSVGGSNACDVEYTIYNDDPGIRNGDLTYTDNGLGGYFTHYVDNLDPNATATGTPAGFGSKAVPMLYPPVEVPAGSIVEIHGTDITTQAWGLVIQGNGTESQPVFIRGVSAVSPADFKEHIHFQGTYVIAEFLYADKGMRLIIDSHTDPSGTDGPCNHIIIRDCELEGTDASSYPGLTVYSHLAAQMVSDTVFYNNEVHDFNDSEDIVDEVDVEIAITKRVSGFWFLDNDIHHNGGDGIQVDAVDAADANTTDIYIGRNTFHDDREAAIALKICSDVIVSENTCYNYHESASSAGSGIRLEEQGAKSNIWVIYNTVYDCERGIDPGAMDDTAYIIGNVIYGIYHGGGNGNGWGINTLASGYVLNNTVYDSIIGIRGAQYALNNIVHNAATNHLENCVNASYNLLWQDAGVDGGDIVEVGTGQSNGIEQDPLMTDPGNDDFTLQDGSPAIDAATAAGIVETVLAAFETRYNLSIRKDILGITRPQASGIDMGAYEDDSGPAQKYLLADNFWGKVRF